MNDQELQALKADFDRDGFVVIRGFVERADLDAIRAHTEQAVSTLERETKGFKNIAKGLEKIDPFFREYLEHGKHLPILEKLIGEKPVPATAAYFSKDVIDEEVHPHPDGSNGATIWLALDPTNEENGCLHFLKGSHRNFEEHGKRFTWLEPQDLGDDPNTVAVILEPGDVSIHDSRTIHWSGKNRSGKPRRGVNCFYQNIDTSMWRKDGKPGKKKQAAV